MGPFSSSIFTLVKDYSRVSTIGGLAYLFRADFLLWKKLFWFVVLSSMTLLGIYWSLAIFLHWEQNQVQVVVKSAGLRTTDVLFPTITICPQGHIKRDSRKIVSELIDEWKADLMGNQTCKGTPSEDNPFDCFLTTLELQDHCQNTQFESCKDLIADFIQGFVSQLSILDLTYIPGILNYFSKETYPVGYLSSQMQILSYLMTSNVIKVVSSNLNSDGFSLKSVSFIRQALWRIARICNEEEGIFKSCSYKTKNVKCEKIFKEVITDLGICCALRDSTIFNKMSAISSRGIFEAPGDSSTGEMSFLRPSFGLSRGLTVTLNAHSDNITRFSYQSNVKGFQTFISSAHEFSLLQQKGFLVPTGHHSLVALTATVYDTDSSLQNIPPMGRRCLFPHENESLVVFEKYSHANCFLECALKHSNEKMLEIIGTECALWYLPILGNNTICGPSDPNNYKFSFDISDYDKKCTHCLPDCDFIKYSHFVTSEKIRPCDEKNFGVSPFCQHIGYYNSTPPLHWIDQAMDVLGVEKFQNYLNLSARRNYGSPFVWSYTTFDAFSEDIAVVSFFFPSQRSLQFTSLATQTWGSYFSMVGGVSGLLIGVSMVTVFELVWILCQLCYALKKQSNLKSNASYILKLLWNYCPSNQNMSIAILGITAIVIIAKWMTKIYPKSETVPQELDDYSLILITSGGSQRPATLSFHFKNTSLQCDSVSEFPYNMALSIAKAGMDNSILMCGDWASSGQLLQSSIDCHRYLSNSWERLFNLNDQSFRLVQSISAGHTEGSTELIIVFSGFHNFSSLTMLKVWTANRWNDSLIVGQPLQYFSSYFHFITRSGLLFISGGVNAMDFADVKKEVYVYNFTNKNWMRLQSIQIGRYYHKCQDIIHDANKDRFDVICIGGMNSKTVQLSEVEIYNFEANLWSFGEPLKSAMMFFELLTDPFGGVLFLGSDHVQGVLRLPTANSKWTKIIPLPPMDFLYAAFLVPNSILNCIEVKNNI